MASPSETPVDGRSGSSSDGSRKGRRGFAGICVSIVTDIAGSTGITRPARLQRRRKSCSPGSRKVFGSTRRRSVLWKQHSTPDRTSPIDPRSSARLWLGGEATGRRSNPSPAKRPSATSRDPILEFVHNNPKAPSGLEAYLTWQLLPPKAPDVPIPPQHEESAEWLKETSLPVSEVDAALWQSYIDRWKFNTRTGRPLAQSSLTRHLADVRQMWSWVCATNQLPDPWPLLNTRTRSSAGGRRSSTVRPVDRTIVLAPNHVRELANICGDGSFGPLAEVYILLLGIAGGRPGESAGVEIDDLDLDSEERQVRFRRTSRRRIDPTFLDPDDDVEWGPLKGREIEDSADGAPPTPGRQSDFGTPSSEAGFRFSVSRLGPRQVLSGCVGSREDRARRSTRPPCQRQNRQAQGC